MTMTVDELTFKVSQCLGRQRAQVPADRVWLYDRDMPSPLDSLCWFISVRQANFVWELTTKDLAKMIRDGERLGGPYQTREQVQEWIAMIEETADDLNDPWGWLDEELDKFYGLNTEAPK